jgi:hypothetical protein
MASRPVRLLDDPVGTPHRAAKCCWCDGALVIAEVLGLRCWVCPKDYRRQLAQALMAKRGKTKKCYHVPLPSQVLIYEAGARYRLWGGRAGPGKSTGGRWWLYHRSLNVPGHEALLLRENWDQLKANHTIKMAVEVPMLGGRWLETDRMAIFGKGSDQSIIYCGHMAETDALQRYLGIEYGAILADEASRYPLDHEGIPVLSELSTRARKEYRDLGGRYVDPVFLPVTNPGGPSAWWLKDMFIDHAPDFDKFPALRPEYDEATGEQVGGYRHEQWVYIAASLRDNPYMRSDYAKTDLAVLSEIRYRQLAEGDWDAFEGQFFSEWYERYHVRHAALTA